MSFDGMETYLRAEPLGRLTLSLRTLGVEVGGHQNRILVTSPKTEHHEGGESRVIPLFPELRELLELALADSLLHDPDQTQQYVIADHRDSTGNLRTHMERIIKKAGLVPWPKLFNNLRSTRETELAEELPLHVVTRWMGNSKPVAAEHYLQVTDAHFAKAVSGGGKTARQTARKEGKTGGNGEKYICGDVAEYAEKQGENDGFAFAGDARDRNRTCTPFGPGT